MSVDYILMFLDHTSNRQSYCVTGVEDGQTVRMPVGTKEVFITFRVEKSDYFRRDGADVHTDAEISLSQAVLGGTIRVRGLYEDQTVQVYFKNCILSVYQVD
jgi:DnaJ-class molecular chaperone